MSLLSEDSINDEDAKGNLTLSTLWALSSLCSQLSLVSQLEFVRIREACANNDTRVRACQRGLREQRYSQYSLYSLYSLSSLNSLHLWTACVHQYSVRALASASRSLKCDAPEARVMSFLQYLFVCKLFTPHPRQCLSHSLIKPSGTDRFRAWRV
jgi:hypothetical protein